MIKAQKAGKVTKAQPGENLSQVILAIIDGLCARAILDPDYKPVELAGAVDALVTGLLKPSR